MIFADTHNAISLPEEGSGQSQPETPDGLTSGRSGPRHARASRSRSPAKAVEQMTQGIYGRTFCALPEPEGPLSLWESRLRKRLALVGSTEFALIWKQAATPHGQSISRLSPSTRHTNGTGSTGSRATWPTPTVADVQGGRKHRSGARSGELLLNGLMHQATWPTPQSIDGNKGPLPPRSHDTGISLPQKMVWPTPQHREKGGGSYADPEKAGARITSGHQVNLQDHMTAIWPGIKSRDGKTVSASPSEMARHTPDIGAMMAAIPITGTTPSGSSVTTEKRGAPNPVFACWLMGFPEEWIFGALQAMQSFRRPRRK